MTSQAPSSSSNPLTRWLKPVSTAQRLFSGLSGAWQGPGIQEGAVSKAEEPGGVPSSSSSSSSSSLRGKDSNWIFELRN
eukprot:1143635-Pelagomonas_calceolata.AAC.7